MAQSLRDPQLLSAIPAQQEFLFKEFPFSEKQPLENVIVHQLVFSQPDTLSQDIVGKQAFFERPPLYRAQPSEKKAADRFIRKLR
jgi:hypothetical protein